MAVRFINKPKYVDKRKYDEALGEALGIIQRIRGTTAVYQLGSTNHPGISDLDLLVVFEDTARVDVDITRELYRINGYLFAHQPVALSKTHFIEAAKYAVWYKPVLLWGADLKTDNVQLAPVEREAVGRQSALEFLLDNYIDLTIQLTYGVIKLRATLQHIKAIRLDLELLGIAGGRMHGMAQELLGWLDSWFESPVAERKLQPWIGDFYNELERLLRAQLEGAPLYMPTESKQQYGRNIAIVRSSKLDFQFTGMSLPPFLINLHKKLFNINTRLNSYTFSIPQTENPALPILDERFRLYRQIKKHVTQSYPHFQPQIPGFCYRTLG